MTAADALDAQAQEIARLTAELGTAGDLPPAGSTLRRLGERLTHLLDDDQWNNIEPLILAASTEADDLRARLAEAERDAERYRWLRDDWLLGGAMAPGIFGAGTAEDLEAIIDAARGGA